MVFEEILSGLAIIISGIVAVVGAIFGKRIGTRQQTYAEQNHNGHAMLYARISSLEVDLERERAARTLAEKEAAVETSRRRMFQEQLEDCEKRVSQLIRSRNGD